jgi:hypothetical protein
MKPFSTADIGLFAESLDDIESVRKAAENRHRALITPAAENGYGLSPENPIVDAQFKFIEQLYTVEKQMIKNLEKAVKAHPLGPWIESQKGVGFKQAGRLLARVNDPFWNGRDGRPRTVSELWAYCGMDVRDGEAPRHKKGQQGNWNDVARMRLWNITNSCLKNGEHYRDVYDETRKHYAEALHKQVCVRCGPSGKPAQPGSPLSDGHKHARGLRKMGKEILKDLWCESKRLHEQMGDIA